MLSIPDFKQKQFIFINANERKEISLKNSNLLIKNEEGEIIQQISLQKIFVIFVIGDFTITTKLVDKLIKYGICVYVLGWNFKPRFIINEPLQGNFLLRERQYFCNNELEISKYIIKNKINNQLKLLKQIRNKQSKLRDDIEKIKKISLKFDNIKNFDSLRGLEGNVAKLFFRNYFGEFSRIGRYPRTKVDIINLLLDIGYTYLFYFVESNLNLYGFDIYKGVFHTQFYERKSLVCDIQEPFRCIIDKKIRKMYNLGQIDEKDFIFTKGAYTLPFKNQKKYTSLLLEEIVYYKLDIFKYIRGYYLYLMKQDRDFLQFDI